MMLELDLAKLLEGTADAAFAVDLQGEVRTWNEAAEKLFGYPASLAIGKSCAALVGGRLAAGTPVCCESCDILECMRKGREISNFDMEVSTRAGQPVWVNVSLLVAANERTQHRLAVHFMRDIREKKKTEQLTNRVLRMARNLVSGAEESGALPPISPLTAQERNILRLLAAGKTTKEITAELQISMRTLRNHTYHVNQKLHTRSRIEAVMQALKRGLV
ncbi:MAG: LuxR C-terminal-related transcriptional regulator [Pyrinomonadaceae bacterium]